MHRPASTARVCRNQNKTKNETKQKKENRMWQGIKLSRALLWVLPSAFEHLTLNLTAPFDDSGRLRSHYLVRPGALIGYAQTRWLMDEV